MIALRIVVERPPAGVDYGLQKGKGSAYVPVQVQRYTGADLVFEFEVERNAKGRLAGPFVQGPADGQFVYLDIGQCAGQLNTPLSRRLKVPLTGIAADFEGKLEARVAGTAKDGTPTCATVKPFSGWNAPACNPSTTMQ